MHWPSDPVPHVAGLVAVALVLLGWVWVTDEGARYVAWTYAHKIAPQTARDVWFGYAPPAGLALSTGCLAKAAWRGFDFATAALTFWLGAAMAVQAVLLIMVGGL